MKKFVIVLSAAAAIVGCRGNSNSNKSAEQEATARRARENEPCNIVTVSHIRKGKVPSGKLKLQLKEEIVLPGLVGQPFGTVYAIQDGKVLASKESGADHEGLSEDKPYCLVRIRYESEVVNRILDREKDTRKAKGPDVKLQIGELILQSSSFQTSAHYTNESVTTQNADGSCTTTRTIEGGSKETIGYEMRNAENQALSLSGIRGAGSVANVESVSCTATDYRKSDLLKIFGKAATRVVQEN